MTTKTDTKLAWEAVGDRLDALGLKLKLHLEQAGSVTEVSEAFERLGSAIEETFSAIGETVQDKTLREDANQLAGALGDALADTVSHAWQELEGAADGLRCHRAANGETPKEVADKT